MVLKILLCSDGKRVGISIQYSIEIDGLLGTGGALKKARNLLDEHFFVVNGDTLFLTNLIDMQLFHKENSAYLTMALTKISDQSRYGSMILEKNNNQTSSRIINFREKSQLPDSLINAGTYLFEKSSLHWDDLGEAFSLEHDLIPKLVQLPDYDVYGFVDENAYFVDIGTPERYKKLENDLESKGKISTF
jgi:NDP-sugar pyrophosphorylase family protein